MNIPPSLKSDCFNMPVLKAIAFGGVDTGKSNAQEADKPIIMGRVIELEASIVRTNEMAMGMKIVVVAVLLMMLEKPTVRIPKVM